MHWSEINPTEEVIALSTKYNWANGPQGCISHWQVEEYIKTTLVKVSCKPSAPYRCCSESTDVYKRIDGKPIDSNDLDALENNIKGQVNRVTKLNDFEVEHYWFCDSGD